MSATLFMRQHQISGSGWTTYASTNDTSFSLSSLYATGSEISAWMSFPRTWLHGKKVRYTRSIGGYSGSAQTWVYGEIMDGEYNPSSSVHFPPGADRINLGNGCLLLIEASYADGSNTTKTTGVLDLSGSSQDKVSLCWRIRGWDDSRTFYLTVTSVQILDASDNVLYTLDINDYAAMGTDSGENYGTMGVLPVSFYTPVSAALEGWYGLFTDHLEQAVVSEYELLASITPAALVGQYSLVMETAMAGRYGDASQIVTALVGRYNDAAFLQAAVTGMYGDTLPVLTALDGRYNLMYSVLAGLDGRYAVVGTEVLAALEGRYDLRTRNEIQAALVGFYSLVPDAVIQDPSAPPVDPEDPEDPGDPGDPGDPPAPTIPWTPVLIGGVSVRWSSVQWTISEDAYLIEASITLRDAAEFASIAKMDTVTITWQETVYTLFVAAKLRARSVSGSPGSASYGVDYTIVARSLTAALDAPYALPTTLSWPAATMASAIAAQLIAPLSDILSLDWRLEDWLQPGGTFFLTDETPLSGLRKLAGIVGGILQTSPTNALIIRRADTVPPRDWPTATPTWIIDDSGVFSDSESEDISSLYNVITVTNQSTGDNSIRFETEEISRYQHRVKGYRVPWVDFSLGTSGGAWVTIENGGVVEESITEVVEFVDGSSTATKPVHSAVSANWLRSQLGAITASEDGSLTSEIMGTTLGCSLAEITYTTKYHTWIGRSDRDEEVQFYAVEIEA